MTHIPIVSRTRWHPALFLKLKANDALFPRCDATADGLLSVLDRDGVDKCFVLNIVTNARQQDHVNEFAVQIHHYRDRIFSTV